MRFPDDVTILRPYGTDTYGNEANSWEAPTEIPAKGFHVTESVLLLPPGTDVLDGDRVEVSGKTYGAAVALIRSPGAQRLVQVTLGEIGQEAP